MHNLFDNLCVQVYKFVATFVCVCVDFAQFRESGLESFGRFGRAFWSNVLVERFSFH